MRRTDARRQEIAQAEVVVVVVVVVVVDVAVVVVFVVVEAEKAQKAQDLLLHNCAQNATLLAHRR